MFKVIDVALVYLLLTVNIFTPFSSVSNVDLTDKQVLLLLVEKMQSGRKKLNLALLKLQKP